MIEILNVETNDILIIKQRGLPDTEDLTLDIAAGSSVSALDDWPTGSFSCISLSACRFMA